MGIPRSIEHSQFEQTECKILQHIGVEISGKELNRVTTLTKKAIVQLLDFPERKTEKRLILQKPVE